MCTITSVFHEWQKKNITYENTRIVEVYLRSYIAYRLFYTIQNVYNIHSHKRFSIWVQKKHTRSKNIPYTISTRVNHILLL